jgi:glycerol uptake facilitator-like aquaporin
LNSSGGFFNPILASALTLNCQGNNIVEHIFVYWLGSLAGSIVARTLHMVLRGETPTEYRKLHYKTD